MGFSRKRLRSGKSHYTAYYKDLKGAERSAGTFTSKKEADKAWQRAEAKIAEGRLGNPGRGRQTFQQYVEDAWLPNHEMEASTRQGYTYSLYKHLMPEFGPMRMVDILPEHVRQWVTTMKKAGVKPVTIRYNKIILSAIFSTAFDDQVIFIHPAKGVKTPTVPKKPRTIITPEQFDQLFQHLPDDDARLLVETAIETGLRWGELTELRATDLDLATRILTVSRAVVEINPKFHPQGDRFLVKEYPKDKEYRRLKLTPQLVAKIRAHIDDRSLSPGALLFTHHQPVPAPRTAPNPQSLGHTEPNAAGRTYRHGTISGYSNGTCKCRHCKDAYALYRAARRAAGKDSPRTPRTRDTDGHIPRDWFRKQVWNPALAAAGILIHVRMHGLRHAHASWLLAGGADLQVVKERLGHASIATTEKYLHTLPDADETALDALTRIRIRGRGG
ncbi:tyrosine-type recombinase/integrase [Nonomuraea sp. NPDC048826]|uniref:tyrosine-type recombinase/integrase n=1 Tax=Nonomuraea sp. NPDC048826 TaxID=3364347 RepID=UPI003719EDC3